jgi:hypothetical protein
VLDASHSPSTVSSRRRPGSILRSLHVHDVPNHLGMDSGLRRNDIERVDWTEFP